MSFFKKGIELFGKKTRDNFLGNKQDECACCGASADACSGIGDCFDALTDGIFAAWSDLYGNSANLVYNGPDILIPQWTGTPVYYVTPDEDLIGCLLEHPLVDSVSLSFHRIDGAIVSSNVIDGSEITFFNADWKNLNIANYVVTLSVSTIDCKSDYFISQNIDYVR
jgi:hypothetical protein